MFKMKENLKTNLSEMPAKIVNGEGSPKTHVSSSVCKCMKFEKLGQGNKLRSFCFDFMMVRKKIVPKAFHVGKTNEKILICF